MSALKEFKKLCEKNNVSYEKAREFFRADNYDGVDCSSDSAVDEYIEYSMTCDMPMILDSIEHNRD